MSSDADGASGGGAFLDSKAARGLAVLVFLGCVAALGAIHRDDLFPESQAQATGTEDVFGKCFAQRKADIANMEKQGVVKPAQAKLFRNRAEALCRDMARKAEKGQGLPRR